MDLGAVEILFEGPVPIACVCWRDEAEYQQPQSAIYTQMDEGVKEFIKDVPAEHGSREGIENMIARGMS